ncbi:MAG: hypothetical protein R3B41_04215 [Candidatus Doudnabacteria bacterium]
MRYNNAPKNDRIKAEKSVALIKANVANQLHNNEIFFAQEDYENIHDELYTLATRYNLEEDMVGQEQQLFSEILKIIGLPVNTEFITQFDPETGTLKTSSLEDKLWEK